MNIKKYLKKTLALYGLKQASRIFYHLVLKYLIEFGFLVNEADACFFRKVETDGTWMELVLFVDDINISGNSALINSFIRFISAKFQIKVVGELKRYIGINVKRASDESIHLDQSDDILKALKRYGLENIKPTVTPFDPAWSKIDEDKTEVNQTNYRSMVGTLFWFAMATRPDILSSVVIVSQFQEKPTKQALFAVKRIFRYLKGTIDLPLIIRVGDNPTFESYSDSSHGDPLLSRYSMSGSMHFWGDAPILWLSRKQRTPALSSAEAELIAASSTARDNIWLCTMAKPYGVRLPTILHVDNQATIAIAESEGLIRHVKHLEIHDLFVRHQVSSKKISIHYIPTELNLADIMTKGIKSVTDFEQKRSAIMAGKRGRDILRILSDS